MTVTEEQIKKLKRTLDGPTFSLINNSHVVMTLEDFAHLTTPLEGLILYWEESQSKSKQPSG